MPLSNTSDIISSSVPQSNLVKTGPQPKYKQEYCDIIVKAAAEGKHIPGMMMSIGVRSKDTWYRWQREYPEFKEAVEYADIVSQATHEDIGIKGMTGQIPGFNSTTYALVMNNKFGGDYKRNPSTATEINITNNTLNLTPEQVQQKIAQKLEKLKSLGVDIEQHVTS